MKNFIKVFSIFIFFTTILVHADDPVKTNESKIKPALIIIDI